MLNSKTLRTLANIIEDWIMFSIFLKSLDKIDIAIKLKKEEMYLYVIILSERELFI